MYGYGGTCAIVGHAMLRNVGGVRPQPFLYVPAVSNVVTTGNGTGTNNVLKWNRALWSCLVSGLLSTALLL